MKQLLGVAALGSACLLLGFANNDGAKIQHSDELDPSDVRTMLAMLGLEAHSFTLRVDEGEFRLNVVIEEYVKGERVNTFDLWGNIDQGMLKTLGGDLAVSKAPSVLELFALEQDGSRVTLRVQKGRLTHSLVREVAASSDSASADFKFHVADWITDGEDPSLKPGARTAIAAYTRPYWDEGMKAYRYCFFDPDMATWGKRFGVPTYFVVSVELLAVGK
jgi:hypothetical protein